MKKLVTACVLFFAVCLCVFAKNSSFGAYGSLYSVQSSKNLADSKRCASVYGFGAKASYLRTFNNRVINWTLGADVEINDYVYSKKAHNNDFVFSTYIFGGVNLIDNEKAVVSFNLGLGPHINVVDGNSTSSLAMQIKGAGQLHLYNNISIGAQLEGDIAFMSDKKSSFEFKTFLGIEFAF